MLDALLQGDELDGGPVGTTRRMICGVLRWGCRGTYRISGSALRIVHSPRSADSNGRQAAVDGQLHPVHEA